MKNKRVRLSSLIILFIFIANVLTPTMLIAKENKQGEEVLPQVEIDIFSNWDKLHNDRNYQPNIIYIEEGKESIEGKFIRLSDNNLPITFNGEELEVKNKEALVKITPGIHKVSLQRWGSPYDVDIECRTINYSVEGSLTPGGKVTIDFNGAVESGFVNDEHRSLKSTALEYETNIPGLKKIQSEVSYGKEVDSKVISKITFVIPRDAEPGEYELFNGGLLQTWGGWSYGTNYFNGKFSTFPKIKINISEKEDLSQGISIDLKKFTSKDKIYTVKNKNLLLLENLSQDSTVEINGVEAGYEDGKYYGEITSGENTVLVDNKEYKINSKRINYSIENENRIIPGSNVNITFQGLEEEEGFKLSYKSNVNGEDKLLSKEEKLSFNISEDVKAGEYLLENGKVEGSNSTLPNISFKVRETLPEDLIPPVITTTLKDNTVVTKDKLSFKVSGIDNVDGVIVPKVSINDEELLSHNNIDYKVWLEEGENLINILGEDASGNKSELTYKVTFTPNVKEGDSIILDEINTTLKVGESHKIIAVDAPDRRSNSNDDTATMKYSIISGGDVVSLTKGGEVKALSEGFAEIQVTYPGLVTPAILQVHVVGEEDSSSPKISTNINESKYDILYFTQEGYDYSFKVDSDATEVLVTLNGEVINVEGDEYKGKLKDGYNLIRVKGTKNGKTTYKAYNIRAKKLDIIISNLSSPGKELYEGDRVKIEFKGLETPVPKFLRVYNPKRTRVEYKTNLPGATNIYGEVSQYDIATKNSIIFTANNSGVFNFTGGTIEESWWGDNLYSEREITNEDPNLSANVYDGKFSKLPSFNIEVKENKDYISKYNYEVLNSDKIEAGDRVTIKFNNIEIPDGNKEAIKAYTAFNSNIEGLEEIRSSSDLNTLTFTIPENTSKGTYTITNGRVYKEWYQGALLVDGEFYKGELPEIKIVVGDYEDNIIEETLPEEEKGEELTDSDNTKLESSGSKEEVSQTKDEIINKVEESEKGEENENTPKNTLSPLQVILIILGGVFIVMAVVEGVKITKRKKE